MYTVKMPEHVEKQILELRNLCDEVQNALWKNQQQHFSLNEKLNQMRMRLDSLINTETDTLRTKADMPFISFNDAFDGVELSDGISLKLKDEFCK